MFQAGSNEYFQEMEELKRSYGSYVKNPSPENAKSMVDAFFGGPKGFFDDFEKWLLSMTPGYLRKLASLLENRGCKNYREYKKGVFKSGIER
ncbi:MAG: hypothetical protein K6G52_05865 [Treponemataceae bacterium]|nr:hypothetical protein [Treponemataceae bacterium]